MLKNGFLTFCAFIPAPRPDVARSYMKPEASPHPHGLPLIQDGDSLVTSTAHCWWWCGCTASLTPSTSGRRSSRTPRRRRLPRHFDPATGGWPGLCWTAWLVGLTAHRLRCAHRLQNLIMGIFRRPLHLPLEYSSPVFRPLSKSWTACGCGGLWPITPSSAASGW